MYSSSPVPLVPLRYPFYSSGNSTRLIYELEISSLIFVVSIFHIIGSVVVGGRGPF